jgi:hypothetical protein
MTFREAIQIQIKALQDIYDNAEGLRDIGGGDEMNHLRRELPKLWGPLQKLDNRLSDAMAQYPLNGNYIVNVTKETI